MVAFLVGSLLVLLPVFSVGLIHSRCHRLSHTCTVGERAEPMATTSGVDDDDVANGSQEHSQRSHTLSASCDPPPPRFHMFESTTAAPCVYVVCAPPACVKTFIRFP